MDSSSAATATASRLAAFRLRALSRDLQASDGRPHATKKPPSTKPSDLLETIKRHLPASLSSDPAAAAQGADATASSMAEAKMRALVQSRLQRDGEERQILHQRVAAAEREVQALFRAQELAVAKLPRVGAPGATLEDLVHRARYVVAEQTEAEEAARGHLEDTVSEHYAVLRKSAMLRTA